MWSGLSTCGLLFHWDSNTNKLEQSKHHHHLICFRHGIAENVVHFELSNNHSLDHIDYILVFFLHLEIYTNQDEKESAIINTKGSNLI